MKVAARGWCGRDSLRGLDCVLRIETSLKVREKFDPASCIRMRDARGSVPEKGRKAWV